MSRQTMRKRDVSNIQLTSLTVFSPSRCISMPNPAETPRNKRYLSHKTWNCALRPSFGKNSAKNQKAYIPISTEQSGWPWANHLTVKCSSTFFAQQDTAGTSQPKTTPTSCTQATVTATCNTAKRIASLIFPKEPRKPSTQQCLYETTQSQVRCSSGRLMSSKFDSGKTSCSTSASRFTELAGKQASQLASGG